MKKKAVLIITGAIVLASYFGFKFIQLKNEQHSFDNLDEALERPELVNTLILRNQNLSSLGKQIGLLKNMKSLNVGNNKLKTLPHELGDLTELEELVLENNFLSKLPGSITQLKKLKVINLNSNLFTQIPPELNRLSSLETVNLAKNKIRAIELTGLGHFKSIDLAENNAREIASDSTLGESLQRLDLYNNELTVVPDVIFHLPLLKELILSGNPLNRNSKNKYEEFVLRQVNH